MQKFDPPELHELSDEDYDLVVEIHRRAAYLMRSAQIHKDDQHLWLGNHWIGIARREADHFFEVGCVHHQSGHYVIVYNSFLSLLDIDLLRSFVLPRIREHMVLEDLASV